MPTATTADLDCQVLAHVTRYPGLSAYEIARVLGYGHRVRRSVELALGRLDAAGKVTWEMVPWPCPGGRKRTWKAAGP